MTGNRIVPGPSPDPETLPFWEAAARDRFVLPKCNQCGRVHWYPRGTCPFCLSSDIEWVASEGLGVIYSCTVFRRADPPYVVAYVELDEGLRLLTNIVADDPEQTAIGQKVKVVFLPASGASPQKVPFFTPIP
ncbi:Zn-ribbon domain-containing OB-fold protein [Pelagibacterium mangrovi]|uniref:Zn-ribbon domain-containing OB-fold protein n=1 Tax=Pelagibacterium mangrovi TaxID=3119828 RepID=UPI002FC6A05F